MNIKIPELSLVALVGSSGSGKSTFAKKHFKATEIISSDFCRGLVSDDESDQNATGAAFDVLHYIASKRLEGGRLTVVDSTNVQEMARRPLIELCRKYHCIPVAIVLDIPEKICHERNKKREDRNFGPHVVRRHRQQLRRSIKRLKREGFRYVYVLSSEDEVNKVQVERQPLWNNLKHLHGPFDIIGDIHGCFDELAELLGKLGYKISRVEDNLENFGFNVTNPEGRRAIFLGDLVDRGPNNIGVLRLVMSMVKSNGALCVPGNHDVKLLRKLRGKNVQIKHGLEATLKELEDESQEFIDGVKEFLSGLISHYVLDDGKLVVAHAGMKESFQGRGSRKVKDFALYGETTGETDEFGLPIRYNWASEYRGNPMVVYGHTPIGSAKWLNRTINIDTGCVFGGRLTALRYPEKKLVDVPAAYTYYEPIKPLTEEESLGDLGIENRRYDDILDIEDVLGKRIINTSLRSNITIKEENSRAALEVMSRFAADPRWLIYLPPTMSPSETTKEAGFLEHPTEAFEYFKNNGVSRVICEEKHMGSRAVIIVCKDETITYKRFKINDGTSGICYTRTGRLFFNNREIEAELIDRLRKALDKIDFWNEFNTDWVCLDCELMPWSAKAQALLKEQYAAVGISGRTGLSKAVEVLEKALKGEFSSFDVSQETSGQNVDINSIFHKTKGRYEMVDKYVKAYRNYCWPVNSLDGIKLAPFHILATEGVVYSDKDHLWHMESIKNLCKEDKELLIATNHIIIDMTDDESLGRGIRWWEELTGSGGEGMVVKPFNFIANSQRGLVQPAVKCRGKEYLRIIYGPEYTTEENISRLRKRALGKKRSLALREFALGMEALERFVRNEPLYRVHECVFGILALESEPIDPRL